MYTLVQTNIVVPSWRQPTKWNQHNQIDGPSKAAWTLPYLVTVNEEYPFGMYVSHPSYFPGQYSNDGRLKWYATSSNKDLIMTAEVSE